MRPALLRLLGLSLGPRRPSSLWDRVGIRVEEHGRVEEWVRVKEWDQGPRWRDAEG